MAVLAGQADAVEAGQQCRAVHLPDHRVDLALEGDGLGEGLDVDDADRLAGIGGVTSSLLKSTTSRAIGGAVQRAGEEAEHQRERRAL